MSTFDSRLINNIIMKRVGLIIFILVAVLLLIHFCTNRSADEHVQIATPFINPAFEGVEEVFAEYTVNAEAGDTLFYKSGSILLFPPNAFVDKDGNIITGEVEIKYREFSDPIDFFISGITMDYDSAGVQYVFESSGMNEIIALNNDIPVFVNPNAQPEINLATTNIDPGHNLYYLDTVQQRWVSKGRDVITDMQAESTIDPEIEISQQELPKPPLKPQKPSEERPVITIIIEEGSVPELHAYHNLKFEIHEDEQNYNPDDADYEWKRVEVEEGSENGTYVVSFIKDDRRVSYLTRPVFEDGDYEEAMKVFESKIDEYQKLMASRLEEEQRLRLERTSIEESNERIARENERITRFNEITERRNQRIAEVNSRSRLGRLINLINSGESNLDDYTDEEIEQARQEIRNQGTNDIAFRTFRIDGFGIWNADKPVVNRGIRLMANFIDEDGNELNLSLITVVYRGFNGLMRFGNNRITALPDSDNMIWSVKDGKFIYLTYDDFGELDINRETAEYTFTMRVHPEEITSIEDIRGLIEL